MVGDQLDAWAEAATSPCGHAAQGGGARHTLPPDDVVRELVIDGGANGPRPRFKRPSHRGLRVLDLLALADGEVGNHHPGIDGLALGHPAGPERDILSQWWDDLGWPLETKALGMAHRHIDQ